jgi:hypothetical protein
MWKILLMTGVLFIVVLLVVGHFQGLNAASDCKFTPRSLVGASWDEIDQAALDFICAKYQTFGGAPQIRMSRFTTPAEFISAFGEDRNGMACSDQQLALIILKGDFKEKVGSFPGYMDVDRLPHMSYIALAFDLRQGVPMGMVSSPHGEKFRAILNDPTIPTQVPAPAGPATGTRIFAVPLSTNLRTVPSCNSGTVVPTILPPLAPPTPTGSPYP